MLNSRDRGGYLRGLPIRSLVIPQFAILSQIKYIQYRVAVNFFKLCIVRCFQLSNGIIPVLNALNL